MTESPIAVTSRPRTRGEIRPAVPDGGARGWEVPGTVAPGIATRGRPDRGTGCPDGGVGCPDGGSDWLDGEVGSADGDVPAGPLAALEAPGWCAAGPCSARRAAP